ncbi:MAG: helix-turn-helix domain-containing protein [Rhodanobacter sp.]
MHPAQIKAALTIAGYKQTEAAAACGVAPTTIGAVINGRSRSKPVEEWIATTTGIAPVDLWPQWYGQGQPALTAEERELVDAYRQLPPTKRARMLAEARAEYSANSGAHVAADRGSVAVGGDFNVGKGSGRGKK